MSTTAYMRIVVYNKALMVDAVFPKNRLNTLKHFRNISSIVLPRNRLKALKYYWLSEN